MPTSLQYAGVLWGFQMGNFVAVIFMGQVSQLSDVSYVVEFALPSELAQFMILPVVDALLCVESTKAR